MLVSCFSVTDPSTRLMGPVQLVAEIPNLSSVPTCHRDLKEVFSKARVTSLPPHQPYDCIIDLFPGTMPPKWRLYSLSGLETQAMKENIQFSLQPDLLRLQLELAFLLRKKMGHFIHVLIIEAWMTLQLRIAIITLLSWAFEHLQNSQIFTKLDLRSAYNWGEWKTAFNIPDGHYDYLGMPFGLTNAPAVSVLSMMIRDSLNQFVLPRGHFNLLSWFRDLSVTCRTCSPMLARSSSLHKGGEMWVTLPQVPYYFQGYCEYGSRQGVGCEGVAFSNLLKTATMISWFWHLLPQVHQKLQLNCLTCTCSDFC